MRAKFLGDPRHNGDGPPVLTYRDHDFPKGEWAPVRDADVFRKLQGNGHFETDEKGAVKPPVEAVEPDPVPVAVQEPETAPAPAPEAVTEQAAEIEPEVAPVITPEPDSDERVAVMARLDELKVPYDKRLGIVRLKAALEVALFERGED